MQKCVIDPKVLLKLTEQCIDIESLTDGLEKEGAFSKEADALRTRAEHKRLARQAVKRLKGPDKLPLIYSITRIDPDTGIPKYEYKQELLFNVEEYKIVIETVSQQRRYFGRVEAKLKRNAKKKFPEKAFLFG